MKNLFFIDLLSNAGDQLIVIPPVKEFPNVQIGYPFIPLFRYSLELMEFFENRLRPVLWAIQAKSSIGLAERCLDRFYSQKNQEDSFYTPIRSFYGEISHTWTSSRVSRRICFKACLVEKRSGTKRQRRSRKLWSRLYSLSSQICPPDR